MCACVYLIVNHKVAVQLHTYAVLSIPVQLVPWRTGTLVAPLSVDAAIFTASTVYTAFINICGYIE